jgi:hypothetical protein
MSCFRFDGSAPAIVTRAAAPHTRPPSPRDARHPRTRAESLIDTAFLWREFAYTTGCRFDVEQKATGAIVFTLAAGGTSLAMPSKLEGTARRSRMLENIRRSQLEAPWQPLTLSLSREDGQDVVLACWNTRLVGRCRPKHLAWLMPLLQTSRLGAHVIQITGGGRGRTLGCNVVFTGIRQALDAHRVRQLAADLGGCDQEAETQRPSATGSLIRVA